MIFVRSKEGIRDVQTGRLRGGQPPDPRPQGGYGDRRAGDGFGGGHGAGELLRGKTRGEDPRRRAVENPDREGPARRDRAAASRPAVRGLTYRRDRGPSQATQPQ